MPTDIFGKFGYNCFVIWTKLFHDLDAAVDLYRLTFISLIILFCGDAFQVFCALDMVILCVSSMLIDGHLPMLRTWLSCASLPC